MLCLRVFSPTIPKQVETIITSKVEVPKMPPKGSHLSQVRTVTHTHTPEFAAATAPPLPPVGRHRCLCRTGPGPTGTRNAALLAALATADLGLCFAHPPLHTQHMMWEAFLGVGGGAATSRWASPPDSWLNGEGGSHPGFGVRIPPQTLLDSPVFGGG